MSESAVVLVVVLGAACMSCALSVGGTALAWKGGYLPFLDNLFSSSSDTPSSDTPSSDTPSGDTPSGDTPPGSNDACVGVDVLPDKVEQCKKAFWHPTFSTFMFLNNVIVKNWAPYNPSRCEGLYLYGGQTDGKGGAKRTDTCYLSDGKQWNAVECDQCHQWDTWPFMGRRWSRK